MPLQIGEKNKFIVKRETDISYTLTPDDWELTNYVFLHFNQATRKLEVGDKITAFLYYDQKKRLCATMEEPLITTTHFNFVEAVNINERAGVFMNIGITKDILLSKDYLPTNLKAWPKIGSQLPCILVEKTDQLVARPITKGDITFDIPKLEVGLTYEATVLKIASEGISVCTNDYNFIFIHYSLTRKKYSLGDQVTVKIININERGDYHGSLIAQKELARLDDSQIILNYLENFGGVLQLGNASTPEEIKRLLNMSKSAFKRAVGALYKERLIEIDDYRITQVGSQKN